MNRPNIITILADDMGFSDLGCYGSEIDTPNLDALAANGLRFTQFYNSARCCPARASLLTGLYPHQAGIGLMVYHDHGDGYLGLLNDHCVTYAEVLRGAGYQTMLSGKWHAGHERGGRPEKRGFDRFTGIYTHVDNYFAVAQDSEVYRDGELYIDASHIPVNPYHPNQEFYTTDFFTDVALDYVDQALAEPEKPFLLHLCYNAPHWPLEAPPELIEKYRGRYNKGWDLLRREKLDRMKRMGIVNQEQTLPTPTGFTKKKHDAFTAYVDTEALPAWADMSAEDQNELDFRRAIYAAQVESMDQNVGRLTAHLRQRGILENTLILFMSDNGCSGEHGSFGNRWETNRRHNYEQWRTHGGLSASQGQCWASLSNAPLRKFKVFVHEGGIASPLIAHWPAGIENPGQIQTEGIYHLIDIMPTLCEVAGAEYPTAYNSRSITPAQGCSLVPIFQGQESSRPDRTLLWQHVTNAAIREGNWKLVTSDDRRSDAWELYDLTSDRSETENLAVLHPERVRQMQETWAKWAVSEDVLPFPEQRDSHRPIPLPVKDS